MRTTESFVTPVPPTMARQAGPDVMENRGGGKFDCVTAGNQHDTTLGASERGRSPPEARLSVEVVWRIPASLRRLSRCGPGRSAVRTWRFQEAPVPCDECKPCAQWRLSRPSALRLFSFHHDPGQPPTIHPARSSPWATG